jgi:hypothetical protein
MLRSTRTAIALGLAVLAAAPAAARAAGPAHVPVPAGQLQHTVTTITFPRSGNTFHHDNLRNERWITATAGRELVTNTTTGKVREDCSYTLKVVRCWAAPLNRTEPRAGTLFIEPGNAVVLQSWIDIGAGVKSLIGQPRGYRVTGSTTFLGRAAITLAQDAQRGPDGGIESAAVVAEADNDYPLFRDDVDTDQPYTSPSGRKGKERVEQVTRTRVMQTISPAGVKLSIGRHPHAKVKDERPAARRSAATRSPATTTPPGYGLGVAAGAGR